MLDVTGDWFVRVQNGVEAEKVDLDRRTELVGFALAERVDEGIVIGKGDI